MTFCVMYTDSDNLIEWRKALPLSNDKHKVQIVACKTEQSDNVTEPEIEVIGDTDLLTGLVWRYKNFEEQFDFAAVRNVMDSYARGEWIMHIDSDERLTTNHDDLWAYLEALTKTDAPSAYVSIYGKTISKDYSARAERFISANMRLHRKSAGLKWQGICHETLDESAFEKKLFADSDIMLYHLGYNESLELLKSKAERNARLLVREYMRKKSERNWDYLKKTFSYLQNL